MWWKRINRYWKPGLQAISVLLLAVFLWNTAHPGAERDDGLAEHGSGGGGLETDRSGHLQTGSRGKPSF